MNTAARPLLLQQVSLGQHLLGHVEQGPDAGSLHHVVSPGHAQLQRLTAPLSHPHHLTVRKIKNIDSVDGQENVSDDETRALSWSAGLYG